MQADHSLLRDIVIACRHAYPNEVRFADLRKQLDGRMEPEVRDHVLMLEDYEYLTVRKRVLRAFQGSRVMILSVRLSRPDVADQFLNPQPEPDSEPKPEPPRRTIGFRW